MFPFDLPTTAVVILFLLFVGVVNLAPKKPRRRKPTAQVVPFRQTTQERTEPRVVVKDPAAPMAKADWVARPLMNKGEFRIFQELESFVNQSNGYRLFTQVSMGEVFSTKPKQGDKSAARYAYMMINSKRVDFLIIDRSGLPIAAIEVQGTGHYQGNAVTRDSIKREAFRLINVPFIEIGPNGLSQGQIVDLRHLLGLPVTVAAE